MDKEVISVILQSAIAVIAAFVLSTIIRKMLNAYIHRNSASMRTDPTNFSFIKNSISTLIYSMAVIYVFRHIPALKELGTALFAGAGIIAAIVGFASQQAFSNIVSGVFIVMYKPFRVGDVIEITADFKGQVEEITLRHTVIRDFENKRIIIPNNVISSETIRNYNLYDERVRQSLDISISYTSDINLAKQIIRDVARSHRFFLDHRTPQDITNGNEDIVVRVTELGNSSINLRVYVWVAHPDHAVELKSDVLQTIKETFDQKGIEIPYPYFNIVNKS